MPDQWTIGSVAHRIGGPSDRWVIESVGHPARSRRIHLPQRAAIRAARFRSSTRISNMTDKQPPLQVGKRIAGGKGLSQVLLRRAGEVELDWDVRQKSRLLATDSLGRTLNVFLP